MATLIFDIETAGKDWDAIPESTQYSLTKWIGQKPVSDDEKDRLSAQAQEKLGLSPFTGEVISLAMYDLERKTGAVYFAADDSVTDYVDGDWKYKVRTEKQLLEDFWETARSYNVFVTFNGRSFDVPFLLHRSLMLDVRPTVELTGQRYIDRQNPPYHVDLLDEFSFYGAMQRRPSLQLLCDSYNISYEKDGVGGEDITEFFVNKRFRDIAEKNAADVTATVLLFEKWKRNLAPMSFVNAADL
jgi:DNA polymerase elongation subunit (family B)